MSGVRRLVVVDAAHPKNVLDALSEALFHDGPAMLPRLGGAAQTRTAPDEVPGAVAVVIETSGTTGRPKRVWLTPDALSYSARTHLAALSGPGVWWLTLPTSYIAGIQVLTRSLVAGTQPITSEPGPFGPGSLLSVIPQLVEAKKDSPVYSAMVPAQFQRLLDASDDRADVLAGLRLFDAILVGGQAIPEPLVTRARGKGIAVIRTYGSAETAGGCIWEGRPLPGVAVREIDGRLAISGDHLAGGYLDDPLLGAKHFIGGVDGQAASGGDGTGSRWYLTDDQALIGSDGSVTILGRVDDVIVSGGRKVSLAQVEKIIVDELGGSGCVVVAGDDEEWGQVPVIIGTTPIDVSAARALIGSRLGAHARPDRFVRVAEIPLLGSGKPDRVALTALISPPPQLH